MTANEREFGCDFTNNFDHITLEDFRFSADGTITNNLMTRNSSILAPHTGEYSRTGISFTDVPGVDVPITGNEISFTDTAVYAYDAGFSLLPIENEYPEPDVFNTFSNVGTGVLVINGQNNTVVSGNVITGCNTGIASNYNTDISILMEKNTITTKEIDVANSKYPIGIDVIDIDCTDPLDCNGSVTIGGIDTEKGNLINSEGLTGISIVGTLNTLVAKNKILMNTEATSNEMWGIKVDGAYNANIQANKINDPDEDFGNYPIDCPTDAECEIDNKRAITILDAFGCSIICNRTNATETGIQFLATDDNVDLEAIVKGNTLQWHNDGLAIGAISEYGTGTSIGQQGSNTQPPGNYWKGDGDGIFGLGATHTYDTDNDAEIFYRNANNYMFPLYFTDANLTDGGDEISMLTIFNIDPFNCNGEPQHLKLISDVNSYYEENCCEVFPNPSVNMINIKYVFNKDINFKILVMDFFGRTLINRSGYGVSGIDRLDLEELSAGLYFLKLVSEGTVLYHKKIIKVK